MNSFRKTNLLLCFTFPLTLLVKSSQICFSSFFFFWVSQVNLFHFNHKRTRHTKKTLQGKQTWQSQRACKLSLPVPRCPQNWDEIPVELPVNDGALGNVKIFQSVSYPPWSSSIMVSGRQSSVVRHWLKALWFSIMVTDNSHRMLGKINQFILLVILAFST